MERVGIGYAKLLLFGEHAAVYGHPALGITLPEAIEVSIDRTNDAHWSFPGLQQGERKLLRDFLAYIEAIVPKAVEGGMEVHIKSSIPRAVGFGSSAALSAAFAEALSSPDTSRKDLWEIAHRAEHFFHGTPSGSDTGLSLLRGLYAFHPAPPALPEAQRLDGFPLYLVTGSVPRSESTASLIAGLRARIDAGDGGVRAQFAELGRITAEAIEAIEEGSRRFRSCPEAGVEPYANKLGRLASSAHAVLRSLALSTDQLEQFLRAGIDLGAFGAKLSGAGGGGAFFLLYPSREAATSAADHLSELARSLRLPHDAHISALSWTPAEIERIRRA